MYRSTQACMRFELNHSIAINVIIMDLMLCFWCDFKITYIFFMLNYVDSPTYLPNESLLFIFFFLLHVLFRFTLRHRIWCCWACADAWSFCSFALLLSSCSGITSNVCVYALAHSRWIVRLIVNSIIIAMIEHQTKAI